MKDRILALLKEAEDFVSGERLSEILGITRSGVWKHINSLKEEGYVIESVRNRGYRLTEAPDRLDGAYISSLVKDCVAGSRIVTLETVDSTNEEVKRLARQGAESGLVVAAESQTAGKGRFSRSWSSGHDGGLYFSILLRTELPPADIASITLSTGYAVCLAIREYAGIDALIKWPNDIIVGSKKLCGILTEMAAQIDRIDYVVTGIGINVNNSSFPEEIADKATSLFLETGKTFDRSEFLACVLKKLDKVVGDFLVSLSIEDIEGFKSLCATMGRRVTVKRHAGDICGTACDVLTTGELVVRTEDGKEIIVNSGEVTVQGIY